MIIRTEKLTIYIPIEIKHRELDSQLLLISELISQGCRCIIGTHAAIFSILQAKNVCSGILLDKGTLPRDKMEWVKERVEKYVVLDQELGPTIKSPESLLSKWPGRIYPGSLEFIDGYLCLNKQIYAAASRIFGKDSAKVKLTGWPRIDFWRDFATKRYEVKANEIQNQFGEFALFVGSSSVRRRILFSSREESSNEKNRDASIILYKKVIDTLLKHGKVNKIVIRPHTSEGKQFMNRFFFNNKKVYVDKRYTITPWILASKAVIHSGSTAAIEARLLNKEVIYFLDPNNPTNSEYNLLMSDMELDLSGNCELFMTKTCPDLKSTENSYFKGARPSYLEVSEFLLSLKASAEKSVKRRKIIISQLHTNKIRRSLGLFRDELRWMIGALHTLPQTRKIPGGIRRKEIEEFFEACMPQVSFQLRYLAINCWEIESPT